MMLAAYSSVYIGCPQVSQRVTACAHGWFTNWVIVCGNMMIEEAKITGMTPAVLTRIGRWVLCPPYILRPTTRLAYCTGMRRCELSMSTTKPVTTSIIASNATIAKTLIEPTSS